MKISCGYMPPKGLGTATLEHPMLDDDRAEVGRRVKWL
jgi:hypothetical protein